MSGKEVDLKLKKLLQDLYPKPTKEEIAEIDKGSVAYDYKKQNAYTTGANDGFASNAEILNFLIKNKHQDRLGKVGWIDPSYLKKLPKGTPPKSGNIVDDERNIVAHHVDI